MRQLLLPQTERDRLWASVVGVIESYIEDVASLRVAPVLDPSGLRELVDLIGFDSPLDPTEAVEFVAQGLREHQVHTPHPRYFGLFNPAPTTMGIAADALAAAFNPQMAAWSHNPFSAEIEMRLIREFGVKFGYDSASADGTFCSGGAEANYTALLCALHRAFPTAWEEGLGGMGVRPVMYTSTEGHHSFAKAARLCGLGSRGIRAIPSDCALKMDAGMLRRQVAQDRADGFAPFLVVGTAGTTSAGVIDPLPELADIAESEGMWFHVDAAWGGGAALAPELRPLLCGIERADSITFDAHKWLSVPMGAGLFLTRHCDALPSTFATAQNYMPRDADGLDIVDPFNKSMQWSRRFIGLKVFMSLAVAGWEGYAAAIRHQTAMGHLLREELTANGWRIVNDTPLPTVCFVDARNPRGSDADYLRALCAWVVSSGRAWISTTLLGGTTHALRACITNYRTGPEDVSALVATLEDARKAVA
jgi:glutamate/tyrosine decarboxylase-like PLP-dependent enzyme